MKMIIGGAHQGQLEWAKREYPEVVWIDGKTCEYEDINLCAGIYDFHEYIKRLMKDEINTEKLAGDLIQKNPKLVIVSDDIGCGLVPIERFMRDYREQTGRICTELAAFSDKVVRVVLGIGTVIKSCEEDGSL